MLHPSLWQNDRSVTRCPGCEVSFTLLRRRHHCRHCGGVFCDRCTAQRLWLRPWPARRQQHLQQHLRQPLPPSHGPQAAEVVQNGAVASSLYSEGPGSTRQNSSLSGSSERYLTGSSSHMSPPMQSLLSLENSVATAPLVSSLFRTTAATAAAGGGGGVGAGAGAQGTAEPTTFIANAQRDGAAKPKHTIFKSADACDENASRDRMSKSPNTQSKLGLMVSQHESEAPLPNINENFLYASTSAAAAANNGAVQTSPVGGAAYTYVNSPPLDAGLPLNTYSECPLSHPASSASLPPSRRISSSFFSSSMFAISPTTIATAGELSPLTWMTADGADRATASSEPWNFAASTFHPGNNNTAAAAAVAPATPGTGDATASSAAEAQLGQGQRVSRAWTAESTSRNVGLTRQTLWEQPSAAVYRAASYKTEVDARHLTWYVCRACRGCYEALLDNILDAHEHPPPRDVPSSSTATVQAASSPPRRPIATVTTPAMALMSPTVSTEQVATTVGSPVAAAAAAATSPPLPRPSLWQYVRLGSTSTPTAPATATAPPSLAHSLNLPRSLSTDSHPTITVSIPGSVHVDALAGTAVTSPPNSNAITSTQSTLLSPSLQQQRDSRRTRGNHQSHRGDDPNNASLLSAASTGSAGAGAAMGAVPQRSSPSVSFLLSSSSSESTFADAAAASGPQRATAASKTQQAPAAAIAVDKSSPKKKTETLKTAKDARLTMHPPDSSPQKQYRSSEEAALSVSFTSLAQRPQSPHARRVRTAPVVSPPRRRFISIDNTITTIRQAVAIARRRRRIAIILVDERDPYEEEEATPMNRERRAVLGATSSTTAAALQTSSPTVSGSPVRAETPATPFGSTADTNSFKKQTDSPTTAASACDTAARNSTNDRPNLSILVDVDASDANSGFGGTLKNTEGLALLRGLTAQQWLRPTLPAEAAVAPTLSGACLNHRSSGATVVSPTSFLNMSCSHDSPMSTSAVLSPVMATSRPISCDASGAAACGSNNPACTPRRPPTAGAAGGSPNRAHVLPALPITPDCGACVLRALFRELGVLTHAAAGTASASGAAAPTTPASNAQTPTAAAAAAAAANGNAWLALASNDGGDFNSASGALAALSGGSGSGTEAVLNGSFSQYGWVAGPESFAAQRQNIIREIILRQQRGLAMVAGASNVMSPYAVSSSSGGNDASGTHPLSPSALGSPFAGPTAFAGSFGMNDSNHHRSKSRGSKSSFRASTVGRNENGVLASLQQPSQTTSATPACERATAPVSVYFQLRPLTEAHTTSKHATAGAASGAASSAIRILPVPTQVDMIGIPIDTSAAVTAAPVHPSPTSVTSPKAMMAASFGFSAPRALNPAATAPSTSSAAAAAVPVSGPSIWSSTNNIGANGVAGAARAFTLNDFLPQLAKLSTNVDGYLVLVLRCSTSKNRVTSNSHSSNNSHHLGSVEDASIAQNNPNNSGVDQSPLMMAAGNVLLPSATHRRRRHSMSEEDSLDSNSAATAPQHAVAQDLSHSTQSAVSADDEEPARGDARCAREHGRDGRSRSPSAVFSGPASLESNSNRPKASAYVKGGDSGEQHSSDKSTERARDVRRRHRVTDPFGGPQLRALRQQLQSCGIAQPAISVVEVRECVRDEGTSPLNMPMAPATNLSNSSSSFNGQTNTTVATNTCASPREGWPATLHASLDSSILSHPDMSPILVDAMEKLMLPAALPSTLDRSTATAHERSLVTSPVARSKQKVPYQAQQEHAAASLRSVAHQLAVPLSCVHYPSTRSPLSGPLSATTPSHAAATAAAAAQSTPTTMPSGIGLTSSHGALPKSHSNSGGSVVVVPASPTQRKPTYRSVVASPLAASFKSSTNVVAGGSSSASSGSSTSSSGALLARGLEALLATMVHRDLSAQQ